LSGGIVGENLEGGPTVADDGEYVGEGLGQYSGSFGKRKLGEADGSEVMFGPSGILVELVRAAVAP
jgi:hypothetical protein